MGIPIPERTGFITDPTTNASYLLSTYHSLHCIDKLRRYMAAGVTDEKKERHAAHCFDYLRQKTLCYADATMEATVVGRTPDGNLANIATGYGVELECKDWTQLREFVQGRAAVAACSSIGLYCMKLGTTNPYISVLWEDHATLSEHK